MTPQHPAAPEGELTAADVDPTFARELSNALVEAMCKSDVAWDESRAREVRSHMRTALAAVGVAGAPAAPEGETDASGKVALTEAEWMPVEDRLIALWQCETEAGYDEFAGRVQRAVERIVAERLRVVEGERDAAVRERNYARRQRDEERAAKAGNWRALGEWSARAESAEAAHAALVAGIEALDRSGRMSFDHSDLRALLDGGGE